MKRSGYTILELVVVLAIMIILGTMALPSFFAIRGNTDQKAGLDHLRASIADSRSLAMNESVPYRLAVSKDGKRLRTAPDTPDFSKRDVASGRSSAATAIEVAPKNVTFNVVSETDSDFSAGGGDDEWTTIGTFMPNGTCREVSTFVEVNETNFPPIRLQLRGITGTSVVIPHDPSNGGSK